MAGERRRLAPNAVVSWHGERVAGIPKTDHFMVNVTRGRLQSLFSRSVQNPVGVGPEHLRPMASGCEWRILAAKKALMLQ